MYKKWGGGCPNFGLVPTHCQISFKVEVGVIFCHCLHGLYSILRLDCVWFLGKVNAPMLVRFEVKMSQVVHILP